MTKGDGGMFSPKNKLRMCLIFVVVLAISMGMLYYYYTSENIQEWGQGTLITGVEWMWR